MSNPCWFPATLQNNAWILCAVTVIFPTSVWRFLLRSTMSILVVKRQSRFVWNLSQPFSSSPHDVNENTWIGAMWHLIRSDCLINWTGPTSGPLRNFSVTLYSHNHNYWWQWFCFLFWRATFLPGAHRMHRLGYTGHLHLEADVVILTV